MLRLTADRVDALKEDCPVKKIDNLPRTQIAGVYHRGIGDVLITGLSDG
jgi:hypothetical protein